jgi:hypothetical protein
LDGITIVQKTLDPIDQAVEFVRSVEQFRGLRRRVLKHSIQFFNLYRSKLNPHQRGLGGKSRRVFEDERRDGCVGDFNVWVRAFEDHVFV